MITKRMAQALNDQMNKELYSAYLYLAMSSYATHTGLKGAANWFMVQYQEEMTHAMKFYGYLHSQGEHAKLGALAAPPVDYGSLLMMFEKTLDHEKFITRSINELVEIAVAEKDHATQIFLQWFVTEQIEEEGNDNDIISRLQLVGETGPGLLMVDSELATRVFTPPAAGTL